VVVQTRDRQAFADAAGFSDGSNGSCILRETGCRIWSFGELAPGEAATVSFGSVFTQLSSGWGYFINGVATASIRVSGQQADPVPDNNTDSFSTYFFQCTDGQQSGCFLEKLFCQGYTTRLSTGHAAAPESDEPRRARAAWLDVTWLRSWMRPLADLAIDLVVYYIVRDDILSDTPAGRRYIGLYNTHEADIDALLADDDQLRGKGIATLQLWEPNLWALAGGQGDKAKITAEQVAAIGDFLDDLSAAASPGLRQSIAVERARLGPLDRFVGLTMEQARGKTVGYAVNLPLISR
jgi:hypothetical protein